MKTTKETKIMEQTSSNDFNPRIIVGIVGSADLETLNEIKDFFQMLDGFKLGYLRASGSKLFITDKKPDMQFSKEIK